MTLLYGNSKQKGIRLNVVLFNDGYSAGGQIPSFGSIRVPTETSNGTIFHMARRKVDEWYWQVGTDLHRIGDEFAKSRPGVATGKYWEPRADVIDLAESIVIRMELAGVRGEDVGLLYNRDRHTILLRGVRRDEGSDEDRLGFYQLEVPYGEFAREISLPEVPIVESGIRAQYRNGFLIVMIPKAERIVVETTVTITNI